MNSPYKPPRDPLRDFSEVSYILQSQGRIFQTEPNRRPFPLVAFLKPQGSKTLKYFNQKGKKLSLFLMFEKKSKRERDREREG